MRTIFFLSLLLFVTGCSTTKKMERNPAQFPQRCIVGTLTSEDGNKQPTQKMYDFGLEACIVAAQAHLNEVKNDSAFIRHASLPNLTIEMKKTKRPSEPSCSIQATLPVRHLGNNLAISGGGSLANFESSDVHLDQCANIAGSKLSDRQYEFSYFFHSSIQGYYFKISRSDLK